MQQYNNISECIKMCDRILRTNTYPRTEYTKSDVTNNKTFQPPEKLRHSPPFVSLPTPPDSELLFLKSVNSFHPSRTIVVQNFLPEAEVHVRSFVAMFGIVEICEVIQDDCRSCLAVVQYKSKTSAADALLAMPYCQIRDNGLAANLLWNGPYENLGTAAANARRTVPRECAERRAVCVGRLPRRVCEDSARRACERYGRVESVRVRPQEQGAFVFAVFRSPLSAAVAVYCLRNCSTSSAALVVGYSENGSPALVGPVRVKPLDQYKVPLSSFELRSICTRFLDYSRMKGLFVNLQRKLPQNHFFRPGSPDYCVRLPASGLKEISLFVEVLLFEGGFIRNSYDITDLAYQFCTHKYLYRFSVDLGLHKPILTHDERTSRPNPQYLRWNAFFVLDLQICFPWGFPDPELDSSIQCMNHIYSDLDSRVFEEERNVSTWFGVVLRHSTCNLTPAGRECDDKHHRNKIKFLVAENLPFVRLAGSCDDINTYQLPLHVYSEAQSSLKTS